MNTTSGSFGEFWAASSVFFDRLKCGAALGRGHEESANDKAPMGRLREAQEQTSQQMQATDARLDSLDSMIATLAGTVAKQAEEIESHERRLGRVEGHAD